MLKTSTSPRNAPLLLLSLIVVVGALLRLYGLENQSLWNDELSSWARSNYATFAEVIEQGALPDVHPPGYHALVYLVERYFGDSETLLRLPSAIAGILTIPAIFWLGRRIYSSREGLIAAALVATLHWPIYFSQEGRAYALLLLASILSTFFWLGIVRRLRANVSLRTQWKQMLFEALAYVVTAIAACYLHYFGLLLVGLQGAALLLLLPTLPNKRMALVVFAPIYALILLAYLPWLPFMAYQLARPVEVSAPNDPSTRTGAHIPTPTPAFFGAYLRDLYNSSRLLLLVALAFYGVFFFQNLFVGWRTKQIDLRRIALSPTFLLLLWLVVPFLVTYLVSITLQPILTRRNLLVSAPAAYLLLARAITSLPIGRIGHALVTTLVVAFSLYQILFRLNYYTEPHKAQFREAVAYVVQHDPLYENSLIVGYAHNPEYFNYYFRKQGAEQRVTLIAGRKEDIPAMRETLATSQPEYLWYISASRDPDEEFVTFLGDNLTLVEHDTLVDADVRVFKVP